MEARKMPTCDAIRRHWAEKLVEIGKFDSVQEVMEANYCFACGNIVESLSPVADGEHDLGQILERAHIKARCEGGTDDLDNLHLLCEVCHKDSEIYSDSEYWEWLKARNLWDVALSLVWRSNLEIRPSDTYLDVICLASRIKRKTMSTKMAEKLSPVKGVRLRRLSPRFASNAEAIELPTLRTPAWSLTCARIA
jgi:hypothetical protein